MSRASQMAAAALAAATFAAAAWAGDTPRNAAAHYRVVDLGASSSALTRAFDVDARGVAYGTSGGGLAGGRTVPATFDGRRVRTLPLLPGDTDGAALAARGPGRAVGFSAGRHGVHPVAFDGSRVRRLGSREGIAWAVNGRGQAAGFALFGSRAGPHAAVFAGGRVQDLETGAAQSQAFGINDSGLVAATAYLGRGGRRAVEYRHGGVLQLVPLPGDSESYVDRVASAPDGAGNPIDDGGEVVGASYGRRTGARAVIWSSRGRPRDLGRLASGRTARALAIGSGGLVVGEALPSSGGTRAVVFEQGHAVDLNTRIPTTSGWLLESARGINERGQLVGWGVHADQVHAFRLDPVAVKTNGTDWTLPSLVAVTILALLGVTFVAVRRVRGGD